MLFPMNTKLSFCGNNIAETDSLSLAKITLTEKKQQRYNKIDEISLFIFLRLFKSNNIKEVYLHYINFNPIKTCQNSFNEHPKYIHLSFFSNCAKSAINSTQALCCSISQLVCDCSPLKSPSFNKLVSLFLQLLNHACFIVFCSASK